jgi:flagellar basal body-associated protein FliL
MRYLFFRSRSRKIDWWTIVLLLISLFSFAGAAAMMWMHSG